MCTCHDEYIFAHNLSNYRHNLSVKVPIKHQIHTVSQFTKEKPLQAAGVSRRTAQLDTRATDTLSTWGIPRELVQILSNARN